MDNYVETPITGIVRAIDRDFHWIDYTLRARVAVATYASTAYLHNREKRMPPIGDSFRVCNSLFRYKTGRQL